MERLLHTCDIDNQCARGVMESSKERWGHTCCASVIPSIRHSKWLEGEWQRATSPWRHITTRLSPCDCCGGGQILSSMDIGCAIEGVGLASSEGTRWWESRSSNSEWVYRIIVEYHITMWEKVTIWSRIMLTFYMFCINHKREKDIYTFILGSHSINWNQNYKARKHPCLINIIIICTVYT